MDMENLVIAHLQDTLHYATICEGVYQPWIHKFETWDYMYLQQTTLITLDVITRCVIIHVWKVLPSKVLWLKG
jgi:hypothetical protein